MHKLKVGSRQLYGLPLAAVVVVEDESGIQADERQRVVEDRSVFESGDERKVVRLHLIGFPDAGDVAVVEETVDG